MWDRRCVTGLCLTVLLGACSLGSRHADAVEGDTPQEVATSILTIGADLDDDQSRRFFQAINTLKLMTPDKNDSRAIGYVTPQFAQMVRGRTVDQLIQMAAVARVGGPPD